MKRLETEKNEEAGNREEWRDRKQRRMDRLETEKNGKAGSEEWRKLVALSSLVLQRPIRLRHK